jgi:hypothetical protein
LAFATPSLTFAVSSRVFEVFPPGLVIRTMRSGRHFLSRLAPPAEACMRWTFRSSSHGSRPLAPPCRHPLVRLLPFRRFRLPFGRTLPPVRSRSASAVSHRPDGLLRTRVAGLLRPAASSRFNAFPSRRPPTRRSSGAFDFPALLLPFEGFSSPMAVSHPCDRCPPDVQLSCSPARFVSPWLPSRLPARSSRYSPLPPRRRSGCPSLRAGRGLQVPPLLLPLRESPPDSVLGVGSLASACGPRGPPAPFPVRTAPGAPLRSHLPSAPACAFPSVRLSRARSTRAAVVGSRLSRSSPLTLAGSALSWDLGHSAHRVAAASYLDPQGCPFGSTCVTLRVGSLPRDAVVIQVNSVSRRFARVPSSGCAAAAAAAPHHSPSLRPARMRLHSFGSPWRIRSREQVRPAAFEVSLSGHGVTVPQVPGDRSPFPRSVRGFAPLPAPVASYR